MKRVVIIGGGISGLAAAHRLTEISKTKGQAIQITILEAGDRLGGSIQTEQTDGYLIELGPDSFISEKPEGVELARRLGLESQLIRTNEHHRRSFVVRHGKLIPVPEGFQLLAPSRLWPFVTTEAFSLAGKLRMAADLLLPRQSTASDDESLASFVRRRLGQEALERMAQPMVGGIYTADPEVLSLRATLPRFLDMEREYRSLILGMWRKGRIAKETSGVSGARYSLFMTFRNGMQTLVDSLKRVIVDLGNTDIRMKTRVVALERSKTNKSRWSITTEHAEVFEADAICLAVPSYAASQLLSSVAPELGSQLKEIRFASTATVNLGFKRTDIAHRLDGFGFVVPFIERRSLIACTFSSVKFAGRAPDDHVLLRAFVGGALQPEMLALDDEEILRLVEKDLNELLRITGKPLFTRLSRWINSMPQYEVGHLGRVAEIDRAVEPLAGLALAGNSYRGAGIPDCIRSGERAAERLLF